MSQAVALRYRQAEQAKRDAAEAARVRALRLAALDKVRKAFAGECGNNDSLAAI
jgi:hypothetical protein